MRQQLAILLALHLCAYSTGLVKLWEKWTRDGGYYGHGPLAVAVVCWLAWRERDQLSREVGPAAWSGLPLVAIAAWLLVGSRGAGIPVVEHYALWLSALGSVVCMAGWAVVRRSWFLWVFTLFAVIPLPGLLLDRLTWQLRLYATEGAFAAFSALGEPAVRMGGSIHLTDGRAVMVDEMCSGLRSAVAMLAMGAVLAYLQPRRWRAAVTFAAALPLALAANAVRILFLCACAVADVEQAFIEPGHSASGALMFLGAFGVLSLIQGNAWDAPGSAATEPTATSGPAPPDRAAEAEPVTSVPPTSRAAAPGWLAALLVAGGGLAAHGPAPDPTPAAPIDALVPDSYQGWVSRDRVIDWELPGVRPGEVVLREYAHPELSRPVELFVIHSQDSERGLHGPRGCYLMQGFRELKQDTVPLEIAGTPRPVGRALVEHGTTRQAALVYFYYRVGSRHAAAPQQHQALLRPRKLLAALGLDSLEPGSSTVRISTSTSGPYADPLAEATLARFAAEVLPTVQGAIGERSSPENQ